MPRPSKKLSLKLDSRNARKHPQKNLDLIDQSLDEVGPFRSIAIDRDNIIRAGNGVFQRAQERGLAVRIIDAEPDELIAVRRADLHGRKAERAALLDNYSGDTSEWDTTILAQIAKDDQGLLRGLWSESEIGELLSSLTVGDPELLPPAPDFDQADEYLAKWKCEPGQLWEMPSLAWPDEKHYLFVGDCRDETDMGALGELGKSLGVFTSPPYAEQRAKKYGGIAPSEYVDWFEPVSKNAQLVLGEHGIFCLNLKAHCENNERVLYVYELVLAMKQKLGWKFIDEFAWVKPGYPGDMGKRFKNGFEPVYLFAQDFEYKFRLENVVEYRQSNFGGYSENLEKIQGQTGTLNPVELDEVRPSNVLHLMPDRSSNEATGGHPARFPPQLPEFFMRAYSDPKDRWFDPFAGSGTTGITAEQLGRLSTQVEILPKYAAVILERYEQTFGLPPSLYGQRKSKRK